MDNFLGHNFSVFQILLKIFHIAIFLKKSVKFQFFQTLSHKNAIKMVEGVKYWQKFSKKMGENWAKIGQKVGDFGEFLVLKWRKRSKIIWQH